MTREQFEVRTDGSASPLQVTVVPGEPGAPAVYVLDAAWLLEVTCSVASMLRNFARVVGELFPDLTVVGIGYPTTDPAQLFALRARDLTPSNGEATTLVSLPPLQFGGAASLLRTLTAEVIPEVESRYNVHEQRRGLAGFSFGGLFGLYTLLHRPETFSDYLVGSPSLWWDDGLPFTWAENWSQTHDDLDARVFGWAGSREQLVGGSWKNERFPLAVLQQLAQVDRLQEFFKQLGTHGYQSLKLDYAVFEGEYHLTAPPAGLTRGLLFLFEGE